MTDDKDKNVESTEKVELTEKQKSALAWMQYVSDQVNMLLVMFLPIAKSGTVGVKYQPHIKARYESGPDYDHTKADGVEIRLVFDFENTIDIPEEPKE
jgi:hypothetical protein